MTRPSGLNLGQKQGRPRLDGAREPNGRLSRRVTQQKEKQQRTAAAEWRRLRIFAESNASTLPAGWSLLNLLDRGKIDLEDFVLALDWAGTDPELAPRWPGRAYLTRITGFDFCSREGCLAARRLVREHLGAEVIKNLDAAVFRGDFGTELPVLSAQLHDVWEVWMRHGQAAARTGIDDSTR